MHTNLPVAASKSSTNGAFVRAKQNQALGATNTQDAPGQPHRVHGLCIEVDVPAGADDFSDGVREEVGLLKRGDHPRQQRHERVELGNLPREAQRKDSADLADDLGRAGNGDRYQARPQRRAAAAPCQGVLPKEAFGWTVVKSQTDDEGLNRKRANGAQAQKDTRTNRKMGRGGPAR